MKKIRLIIVAIVLTVTAFGGGLLVNAALSTPSNANASSSHLAAVNDASNPALDDSAASAPDDTSMADMANAMNAMGMSQAMPDFSKAGGPAVAPGKGPEAGGVISTTAATTNGYTLTLKGTGRVVTINSSTTLGDSNGTINASDLKAGDFIFALGTAQSDGSLTARWVLRLPAPAQAKTGTVSSVNVAGNSFQFTDQSKSTWTVNVTSNTRLAKNGQAIKLSDIAVNDKVVVLGTVDANAHTIAATNVTDGVPNRPTPGNATAGTVSSIDTANNSFVITPTAFAMGRGNKNQAQPSSNNAPVTVSVDSNTRFVGANLKSLSDLKAGDKIIVTGQKQSDGSIKAITVARVPANSQRKPGNNGNQRGNNQKSQNNNTSSNTGKV